MPKFLADEFGLVVGKNFKTLQITELITKSKNYDEVVVKGMLQVVTEECEAAWKGSELAEETLTFKTD